MGYNKRSSSQYARKIGGWVAGYQCRGQYRVFRNGTVLPKSVESVDLIVPIHKDLQLPIDAVIEKNKFTIGKFCNSANKKIGIRSIRLFGC